MLAPPPKPFARHRPAVLAALLLCIPMLWLTISATRVAPASITGGASPEPLTVYYWPMIGRAGHIFWMLDYAGVPYEHVWQMPELRALSSSYNGHDDNFAPPILRDGDLLLSQSSVICHYLGEKLGLDKAISNRFKAEQHLNDLQDFFDNVGRAATSVDKLHIFTTGGRLDHWLGNIERSIEGPYYYGELSYVDFYLAMGIEWAQNRAYNALRPLIGDPLEGYLKIIEVVARIRSTNAYRQNTLPGLVPVYVPTADFVAAYAKLMNTSVTFKNDLVEHLIGFY